jgi:phage N-6-adenine-methyltransferase
MSINKGMMSSKRDDWETPQEFYDNINSVFGFAIDAAASEENAKADIFFTKEDDGLIQNWTDTTWVNPPYGRVVGEWVKKGYQEATKWKVPVVMLVAARTDTIRFHKYVMRASEVFFIKGRITFVGAKDPAPFPSMVVVFDAFSGMKSPDIYSMSNTGKILSVYP